MQHASGHEAAQPGLKSRRGANGHEGAQPPILRREGLRWGEDDGGKQGAILAPAPVDRVSGCRSPLCRVRGLLRTSFGEGGPKLTFRFKRVCPFFKSGTAYSSLERKDPASRDHPGNSV
jgi:hypothetical protein